MVGGMAYGCLDFNNIVLLAQYHGMLRCDKPLRKALPVRMQLLMPASSSQDLNAGYLSH